MPYKIQPVTGGFIVVNSITGQAQSKRPMSRTRARRQMRALYANVPDAQKAVAEGSAAPAPSGGKRMTRAEAARHASLVRWKKESPLAANVQERLAQIRAARANKGKKKGGGGKGKAKGGKPKDARTPQEKANQNRAAVAKQSGMGDLEGTVVRLGAGMHSDMEKDAHDNLISKGLAKRDKNGVVSLTPAGKKWRRAADKGDADGANAALAEGQSKQQETAAKDTEWQQKQADHDKVKAARQKKQKERKAKRDRAKRQKEIAARRAKAVSHKGMEQAMDSLQSFVDDMSALHEELSDAIFPAGSVAEAIKAGMRNSSSDQATIDRGYELAMDLCDLFESLGADTGEEDAEAEAGDMPDDEEAEMKAMADDPVMYAQHECYDIQAASQALSMLASLAQSEAMEQDEDTTSNLAKLRQAMQILTDFIGIEINEVKAIGKREDVNPKAGISEYGDVQFADAKNKKYPIDTPDHIRAAWNYIAKEANAAKYDPAEVATIKKNIVAAWKKKIDAAGPPSAETKKSLDADGYTKGIEFYQLDGGDELAVLPGYSVKALDSGEGLVGGYLVKFGGDGDMSNWRDVFDAKTDFGRHTKTDVWVHHRMLPGVGKRRLNNQAEIGVDDEGVFIKHLLDLRSQYERKLYEQAVKPGKMGWSSGTAPHLVERKAMGDGRHAVTQWILGLDASYTPIPAGGLEVGATALKSLFDDAGIDLLNAIYDNPEATNADAVRSDATKTADDDRSRRLLLRARMLSLQE